MHDACTGKQAVAGMVSQQTIEQGAAPIAGSWMDHQACGLVDDHQMGVFVHDHKLLGYARIGMKGCVLRQRTLADQHFLPCLELRRSFEAFSALHQHITAVDELLQETAR